MTLTVPQMLWVFNPTYVEISGASSSAVTVSVGSNSISVSTIGGYAKVMISRLAQLAFDAPETTRSKYITIGVSEGDDTESYSRPAIWGAVGCADSYAQFASNGIRKIQHFVYFPFTVDTFNGSLIANVASSNLANEYFDPVYGNNVSYVLESRREKEGVYLRWIDRFGFIQYYLFTAGDIEIASNPSSHSVEKLQQIVYSSYASASRPLSVETKRSYKICAVNLDADTIEYVSSIVGSPIIDMYINDKWIPVSVKSGTYKYSQHHLKHRQDFEITIELPSEQSQTL